MRDHDKRIIHSSERADWRTDPALFDRLAREFRFALDVAADSTCPTVKTIGHYLGPGSDGCIDGLAAGGLWQRFARGRATSPEVRAFFMNPPYSKKLAAAFTSGKILVKGVEQDHPIDLAQARAMRIENWMHTAWVEGQKWTGVGIIPYSPQTRWWRSCVCGLDPDSGDWRGFAAVEVRKLPHRATFFRPDGEPANNAPGNTAVVIWRPDHGYWGPWQPVERYWTYRDGGRGSA